MRTQETTNRIRKEIERICTEDVSTCPVGYCIFNRQCSKQANAGNGHGFGCVKSKCHNVMVCSKLKHCIYTNPDFKIAIKSKKRSFVRLMNSADENQFYENILDVMGKVYEHKILHKQNRERNQLLNKINSILGQNVFDHDLVKGNADAKAMINNCKTLADINKVLAKRYKKVHGRKISLPNK